MNLRDLEGQTIREAYEQEKPYFALILVTDKAKVEVTMDSGYGRVDIHLGPVDGPAALNPIWPRA